MEDCLLDQIGFESVVLRSLVYLISDILGALLLLFLLLTARQRRSNVEH